MYQTGSWQAVSERHSMTTSQSSRVLIIGYGEMGHAMETLLADRHSLAIHDVALPAGMPAIDPEAEAARADFVLLCVPAATPGRRDPATLYLHQRLEGTG